MDGHEVKARLRHWSGPSLAVRSRSCDRGVLLGPPQGGAARTAALARAVDIGATAASSRHDCREE